MILYIYWVRQVRTQHLTSPVARGACLCHPRHSWKNDLRYLHPSVFDSDYSPSMSSSFLSYSLCVLCQGSRVAKTVALLRLFLGSYDQNFLQPPSHKPHWYKRFCEWEKPAHNNYHFIRTSTRLFLIHKNVYKYLFKCVDSVIELKRQLIFQLKCLAGNLQIRMMYKVYSTLATVWRIYAPIFTWSKLVCKNISS